MSKASIELQGLEPHRLADQISSLFVQWNTDRQVWLKRVREVIQYVYATSTRETTNSKNPWSHSTVIPKLTQIHDNLGANYANALFGGREFFTFDPATKDEANVKKRVAIVNYLTTKHDYNGFRATMKKLLDDWVQTGNCFCRVEYVRETAKDPISGETVTYEGPKPIRISPYDIVFDPTVTDFKDSPKIIRELVTRGEMMRRTESPEGAFYNTPEIERIKKFYSVISQWKDVEVNKTIQMTMDGFGTSSAFFRSGKVELLHFIGDIYDSAAGQLHKDRLITIVDRRYILQDRDLADLQGFGKIYHSGWRKRPDNLWAQGPLDNLVGMQYLINHLENARADGFDQMLSPDRVMIGSVEIEKDGPVTNYYVDDAGGDVKNLAPDPTVLNADNQIQLKEAQMESYAGAPREAMGIRSPGEKTAFEVSSLQNAAGRVFQTKIEDFEQEMAEPVLNGELEVSVLNINASDVAKVLDDDFGVEEFLTITREDLTAKGKLKARGASHYAKRAQLVQELQAFSAELSKDPDMKVHFPAKRRAKAWNDALGFDKLELYQPFGQIEEAVELHEHQQAAQEMVDNLNSAGMTDVETQDRAAGAASALSAL
jgi:hypothetical protein